MGKDKATILLASPDAAWTAALARALEAEGYQVRTSRNGVDALYQTRMRRPDLVFLDPELPQLSGWEVCRRLKRGGEFSTVKVALLTLEAKAAFQAGADAYLGKSSQIEPSLPPLRVFRTPQGILGEFLRRRALAA